MANFPLSGNEWKCATIEKPASKMPFGARLSHMAACSGRSRFNLLKEIITLKRGAGRLSFDEYEGLRLYDRDLYGDADRKAFVGFKALQKIWLQANYRYDFYGLVNNKIATDILLAAYGFPIMPTIAIFRDQVGRKSPFMLRSEEELRQFLMKEEHYPFFCKPMSGHQSIGSASIESYHAQQRRLITTMGHGIPLDTFITYVKSHAASGYLFQRRVLPHASVRNMCGNRLATVRLLTMMTRGKAKILSACWKIPAGVNVADNFWRPGNLLAQLDLHSGRVLRVIRGNGIDFETVTHHPDTREPIVGMFVPHWSEITQLVTESAKVLEEIALIGWDIAPVDTGAIIVEVNETPDFKLHQLVDRQGLLNGEFKGFLAERKLHAQQWLHTTRQKVRSITELVPPPPAEA